jgi:hypothetical protein
MTAFTIGMITGDAILLNGALLMAHDLFAPSDTSPIRIWNVIQWPGLGPPVPHDPRLIGPTLAVLNSPAWIIVTGYGMLIVAGFWLMRAIDHE